MKRIIIIFGLSIIWFVSLSQTVESQASELVRKATIQVAKDYEIKYDIAVKSGTPADIWVWAGFVTEAYLQAKDEVNYTKWKKIKDKSAKEAGME